MQNKPRHKLQLADYISLAVLLSTCIGIHFLLTGHTKFAILCGGISFILDTLDGYAARKLNQSSEFGRQMDSMIDLITYPIFSALFIQLILIPNIWGALVGFFVIATAALRLLDFNNNGFIKHKGKLYYRGLVVCHISLITSLLVILTNLIQIP